MGFRAYLNPVDRRQAGRLSQIRVSTTRNSIVPIGKKFERMLKYAREKEMIVSVIFGWNDTKVHPAPRSVDERRYLLSLRGGAIGSLRECDLGPGR